MAGAFLRHAGGQMIGNDLDAGNAVIGENPTDEIVYPVAYHAHADAVAPAKGNEIRKAGIDLDRIEKGVEFRLRGLDQRDLRPHAFRSGYLAFRPGSFEALPFRSRKSLQNTIGDVLDRDRSVEITKCMHVMLLGLPRSI